MDRNQIKAIMNDIYTSSEAAEYLQISTQRLNQLVHDKQIEPIKVSKSIMLFLKEDLEKRKMTNVSNNKNTTKAGMFNINNAYVRDAILYYTIQQYFNNNDKKTCEYIDQLEKIDHFDFRSGLKNNIPYLSSKLNISEKEIPTVLLNIATREGIYNEYRKGNLETLLNEKQDILKGNINILRPRN